jgi:hypothetical protein
MHKDVYNERLKLTASWLNQLATAVTVVGGISPIVAGLSAEIVSGVLAEISRAGILIAADSFCNWVSIAYVSARTSEED